MPRCASTEKAVRHYVGFVNPRTSQRETIWFSTPAQAGKDVL